MDVMVILILTKGSIVCSNTKVFAGLNAVTEMAKKSDIPAAYVHPSTKQCSWVPSGVACELAININNTYRLTRSGAGIETREILSQSTFDANVTNKNAYAVIYTVSLNVTNHLPHAADIQFSREWNSYTFMSTYVNASSTNTSSKTAMAIRNDTSYLSPTGASGQSNDTLRFPLNLMARSDDDYYDNVDVSVLLSLKMYRTMMI